MAEPDSDGVLPETPLPLNLELAVKELRKVVDERERLKIKLSELEVAEETFRSLIKTEMQVQGVRRFATEDGSITGRDKMYYNIKDFSALQDWVLSTGHLEIFQRRLTGKAIEEIGEAVPGVDAFAKFEIVFRRR